jgi:hypothetical protein
MSAKADFERFSQFVQTFLGCIHRLPRLPGSCHRTQAMFKIRLQHCYVFILVRQISLSALSSYCERSASVQRAFGYAVHKLPSALIASVGRALGERWASNRPAFGQRSACVRRAFGERSATLFCIHFGPSDIIICPQLLLRAFGERAASVRRACSERSATLFISCPQLLLRALGERSASVRPAFGVRSASVRRAFRYTVVYSLWFAF